MTSTTRTHGVQAILHVGDMKCGSKSIQEWMTQDRDVLAANGCWLSDVTRIVHYDSRLSSYALEDERLDVEARRESGVGAIDQIAEHRRHIEERLAAEVASLPSSAQAMVFSHELMLSLWPSEVNRLVALLRRIFTSLRVVAYIRRQDRLFLSLSGQRLKSCDPGPRFFEQLFRRRSYLGMLDTWATAVGRENLVIRVFDKPAFTRGDLQADFRVAAGIPDDGRFAPPLRTNESLDAAAQTLLLELGARLTGNSIRRKRRLLDRLVRAFQPKSKRLSRPIDFPLPLKNFLVHHRTGRSLLPDRHWAHQIMKRCERENETIRQRYFPDRAQLFDDDFSDYPAEGGQLGRGLPRCDPEAFRHPAVGPVAPDDVREAYRMVLGREPEASVIDRERTQATNIAQVYASLLARSRAA